MGSQIEVRTERPPDGFQDLASVASGEPRSGSRAETWAQEGPKRSPKRSQNDPKIVFLRVLGHRGEKREPRSSPKGSPGTPRGSKLVQNGPKIGGKMEPKINHRFRAA